MTDVYAFHVTLLEQNEAWVIFVIPEVMAMTRCLMDVKLVAGDSRSLIEYWIRNINAR